MFRVVAGLCAMVALASCGSASSPDQDVKSGQLRPQHRYELVPPRSTPAPPAVVDDGLCATDQLRVAASADDEADTGIAVALDILNEGIPCLFPVNWVPALQDVSSGKRLPLEVTDPATATEPRLLRQQAHLLARITLNSCPDPEGNELSISAAGAGVLPLFIVKRTSSPCTLANANASSLYIAAAKLGP